MITKWKLVERHWIRKWKITVASFSIVLFVLLGVFFLYNQYVKQELLEVDENSYLEGFKAGEGVCVPMKERLGDYRQRLSQTTERLVDEQELLDICLDDRSKYQRMWQSCENTKPLFMQLAKYVAEENEYTEDYVCEDFASDLVKILKAAGYDAYKVRGYYYDNCDPKTDKYNCRHTWVGIVVPIEAVVGDFPDPDYYKEYYVEK